MQTQPSIKSREADFFTVRPDCTKTLKLSTDSDSTSLRGSYTNQSENVGTLHLRDGWRAPTSFPVNFTRDYKGIDSIGI